RQQPALAPHPPERFNLEPTPGSRPPLRRPHARAARPTPPAPTGRPPPDSAAPENQINPPSPPPPPPPRPPQRDPAESTPPTARQRSPTQHGHPPLAPAPAPPRPPAAASPRIDPARRPPLTLRPCRGYRSESCGWTTRWSCSSPTSFFSGSAATTWTRRPTAM